MSIITILLSILLGTIFGAGGGALTGWRIAGKDLGDGFASLMGAMFGMAAAVPGTIVGIIILALIS